MAWTEPTRREGVLAHDARWTLVQRIASSRAFVKAPKLREFLLFICESMLCGQPGEVSEQEIAAHVFKRDHDFHGTDDSIVRVTARELRKKLAVYFETDGAEESIVLTIPKGGYTPVFAPRESVKSESPEKAAEGAEPCEPSPQAQARPATRARLARWLAGAAAVIVLASAGWVAGAFFSTKDLPAWARPEARGRLRLLSHATRTHRRGWPRNPVGAQQSESAALLCIGEHPYGETEKRDRARSATPICGSPCGRGESG